MMHWGKSTFKIVSSYFVSHSAVTTNAFYEVLNGDNGNDSSKLF